MNIKNFEFKARVRDLEKYEEKLWTQSPTFLGLDHQIDTYFNAPHGRLKLREGDIENALIHYEREDSTGLKESHIILYQHQPSEALKCILIKQFGIKVIVDKSRKIYFIDNIKFHFDKVEGLGTYIEVEAIDDQNAFTLEELKAQCYRYFDFFGLKEEDLIDKSYSDLLLEL